MKTILFCLSLVGLSFMLFINEDSLSAKEQEVKEQLIRRYEGQAPTQWGSRVTGVLTRMATKDKVIALTFDACGGKGGSGYDRKLIDYLIKENVPATLFINTRWIDANKGNRGDSGIEKKRLSIRQA